jgi:Leucine-rich repeat (LRR) protein
MKQITILIAMLFSTSIIAAADAFSVLDADNDNAISKDEASSLPGLTDHWKELDVNADNKLSIIEFQAYATTSDATAAPDLNSQQLELN